MAQGEGNRDTTVIRGNSSTADFFVDGLRDDVQYMRDLYNIERVEGLKGPNAMIFGRGGSGGVINRVTKQADWHDHGAFDVQLGSWNRRRASLDVGHAINDTAAFRVNAVTEDSESYRDGYELRRYGLNPTVAFRLGEATMLNLSYEHFRDDRVADRGVPSLQGAPLETDPETFFGDPERSPVWARVNAFNAVLEHDFANGVHLRNATVYGDYDKFYQNIFPSSTNGTTVTLGAYNNFTTRENAFNQTDVTFGFNTGNVGHTLLAGVELGRQVTGNRRETGYFGASNVVPVSNPVYTGPITFQQSATDSTNRGTTDIAAVYVQDQIEFSPKFQAIVGVRYDQVDVDFTNVRTGARFRTRDGLASPRVGLVYKPLEAVSLYASYSNSFLPRAGEQLSSLSLNNAALDPEEFKNYEVGAKWDVRPALSLTAAVYRLDRENVAVATNTPGVSELVKGQRTEGVEIGLSGDLTERWKIIGGYAYQDSENLLTGKEIASVPRNSASLWNRYDFNDQWGVGVGATYRDDMYAAADNAVVLPGYTRVDASVFYTVSANIKLQLNVENLLDEAYYASAHTNNNITPGAPRGYYLSASFKF
jgi:catecholate siderophore receptor